MSDTNVFIFFADTDESRFRLPEREAAKCLLFLSQTPPSHSGSPNLIPGRPMTYPYADQFQKNSIETVDQQNARRPTSFQSPVFEYIPRPEQYYANPKISPLSTPRKCDDASMPIDLTKPRNDETKYSESIRYQQAGGLLQTTTNVANVVNVYTGPAGLLTSLVSITDKVPLTSPHGPATPVSDENVLLQSYLTERALLDSKMKQSQMYRVQMPNNNFTSTTSMASTNSILSIPTVSSRVSPIGLLTTVDFDKIEPIKRRPSPLVEVQQTNFPANSFDALKNSPNPSKVTYTKLPNVARLTESWTPKIEVVPPVVSRIATSEQQTITTTTTTTESVYTTFENNITRVSFLTLPQPKLTSPPPPVSIPNDNRPIPSRESADEPKSFDNRAAEESTSGMDTLAEIAASSVKLDTNSTSVVVEDQSNKVQPIVVGNSAKSVASEYLKRTSAEYMKAHKSDREDSDESDSEDDGIYTAGKGPSDLVGVVARTVVVGEDGFKTSATAATGAAVVHARGFIQEDGRSACTICSKTFPKKHQMILHMNIHYMERKFRCEPCAVSFRTQGHLQKHERSEAHKNKVLMTSTFGVPTTTNPRPFECSDCKIAFRIHGHLAKHLRSKTHVQKLECLQKLPFGTYAEIERAGISLTDIDTTDCDNSLASLKVLAQKLLEKDPSKLGGGWPVTGSNDATSSNNNHYSTSESRESNSDDGGEPICSADDESSYTDAPTTGNDVYGAAASTADSNLGKRKIDAISGNSNDSTVGIAFVENPEKRLKIFSSDT